MKDILGLVSFTAGAICLAVFLAAVIGEGPVELGSNRSIEAPAHASSHSCRFHGLLLAEVGSLGTPPTLG